MKGACDETEDQDYGAVKLRKCPKNHYTRFSHGLYSAGILKNLSDMRKSKEFCDITLVVQDEEFPAHRAVLVASSSYFRAMFSSGMEEKHKDRVVIHGVNGHCFDGLLDFIYSGDVQVDHYNVQELLQAADMLQIRPVVLSCCDFLKRELDASNCLGIYKLAEIHDCAALADAALSFAFAHFVDLVAQEEFLNAEPEVMLKLLDSELLRIDTEFQVLTGAMAWLKHNVEQRRRRVFEMLSKIRIALIPMKLLDQVAAEEDPSLRVAVRSMINDLVSRRGLLVALNAEPRACARKVIYVFGGAKREMICTWTRHECTLETVVALDTFSLEWKKVSSMDIGRIHPGVCVLDRKIFVFGGEKDSQILANGESYDPNENTWGPAAPMVVPRCEFGLCAFGESLYAFGGWVGEDLGGTIEKYCPESDTWTLEGEMPQPKFSMGVVVYKELMYMVGGCTQSQRHVRDLLSFNPFTKEWSMLPQMIVHRSQMGVCVLDNFLYVVGGTNRFSQVLKSVERYCFDTETWELVAEMTVGRANPAVAAADGKLYVIGGEQTVDMADFYRAHVTISDVEMFDPLKNAWAKIASLPESRSEAGVAVI